MTVTERPLLGKLELRPWVTRVNSVKNPQPQSGGSLAEWQDRWSWSRTIIGAGSGGPLGAFPFWRWTSPSSQDAHSRGWGIYGNPDIAIPGTDALWKELPVTAGEPISIQFYVRSSLGVNWNVIGRVHDGMGSWLTDVFHTLPIHTVPANTWTWVKGVYTPAVDGFLVMRSTVDSTGLTYPTGGTIDAGRFQIEYGNYGDNYYIDGDAGTTDTYRFAWAGVPANSVSVYESEAGRIIFDAPYGVGTYGDNYFGGQSIQPDLLADSTTLSIRRGGTRDGLGIKTDVGLMTFTLLDVEDPMDGGTLAVGQKVRCMSGSPLTPLFTGRIAYVTSTYVLDKATGDTRALTQVTVADAVNVHVSTMRYGRDLGEDPNETFEERIAALALSSNAPIEVPITGAPLEVYSF